MSMGVGQNHSNRVKNSRKEEQSFNQKILNKKVGHIYRVQGVSQSLASDSVTNLVHSLFAPGNTHLKILRLSD